MAAFDELPGEIIDSIISWLPRPSDLKTLCLVSSRIWNFAVPKLYKDIRLSAYQNHDWNRLDTLCNSRQLHHIRSIDIGDDDVQRNQICKGLRELLKRLPRGQLSGFYYHPAATPQARDIRYLWHTQPNLERLNFSFRMCSPALIDLVNQDGPWLQRIHHIKDISIDLGDTTDVALVERFLALIESEHIRKATISWPLDVSEEEDFHRKMIGPVLKWLPPKVETLSLHWLPFEDSLRADEVCLPALRDLELRACYKAAVFLDAVAESPIERLALRLHGDTRGDFLDMNNGWADVRHSVARMANLRTLIVPNNLVSRQVKLLGGTRLQAMSNLRALMLNYTPDQVTPQEVPWGLHPRTLTGNLVEVAVKLGQFPSEDFTKACLCLIKRLPCLEVLNVFYDQTTWMTPPDHQPTMQFIADSVFATLSNAHPLRILAFGMKWRFGSSLEALSFSQPKRACYLRVKDCRWEEGKGQSQYIPEEDLNYVYPNSEILDYAFSPHSDDAW